MASPAVAPFAAPEQEEATCQPPLTVAPQYPLQEERPPKGDRSHKALRLGHGKGRIPAAQQQEIDGYQAINALFR